jgi:predicted lipid-binding transport protein (Tim44 family)
MSTGTTIAIVGGVVAVGAVALIALRPSAAKAAPARKPASSGPSAGTLIAGLGGSLVSRISGDLTGALTNLFGGSKSQTITATASSSPASAWNSTETDTFDELAAGDAAMGVEGPF